MGSGPEPQVTPIVNGSKQDVGNSSTDAITLRILSGEQTVISHGASQYRVGGVSACGLAALNCARIVLTAEKDGPKGRDLLKFVTKAKTAQVSSPDRICDAHSTKFFTLENYIHLCPVVKLFSP